MGEGAPPTGAAGASGPVGAAGAGTAPAFLAFYDDALPHVYGYLVARCGSASLAEDLTAETFLAAVDAVRREAVPVLSVAWAIGVARHKLADHWRRRARMDDRNHLVEASVPGPDDPWEARLEAVDVARVLQALPVHHRAALTLRYLDDLPVPDVAHLLGRTVHATEALLVRARAAFRRATEGEVTGA